MAQFLSKPFGMTPNGEKINEYIISNPGGLAVSVLNYGCIIKNIWVPTKRGPVDVVLGHDTYADYVKDFESSGSTCCGAFVGRYANRIENAVLNVGGKTYQLEANNGKNHLHGTFPRKLYEVKTFGDTLLLEAESPDGEDGFPGNLKISVRYILTEDNALRMDYRVSSDADTIINLTNHTYFNLDGGGETRRAADVLRAAATARLLAASEHEGIEGGAVFHVQRADALRAAHLMSGKRCGVAAPIDHVDGHLAKRLRGIGVEQRAGGVRRAGKLGHGLHRAYLGVRRHDADEHRFGAHDLLERGRGYEAVAVGLHARDREAHLLEALGRGQDRIVLDGADHHVRLGAARPSEASGVRCRQRQPDDGGVVGLGGAAGEDHLVGTRGA